MNFDNEINNILKNAGIKNNTKSKSLYLKETADYDIDDTLLDVIYAVKDAEESNYSDSDIIDLYKKSNYDLYTGISFYNKIEDVCQEFNDKMINAAYESNDYDVYEKKDPWEAGYSDELSDEAWSIFNDDPVSFFNDYNSDYYFKDFIKKIKEKCEEYYETYCSNNDTNDINDDNVNQVNQPIKQFDPESIDTLDESFNPNQVDDENIIEAYNYCVQWEENDLTSREIGELMDCCRRCNYSDLDEFVGDELSNAIDGYVNDEDHWREEYDSDATSDAIDNESMDELIRRYSYRDDNEEFTNNIKEILLDNGYNVDDYNRDDEEKSWGEDDEEESNKFDPESSDTIDESVQYLKETADYRINENILEIIFQAKRAINSDYDTDDVYALWKLCDNSNNNRLTDASYEYHTALAQSAYENGECEEYRDVNPYDGSDNTDPYWEELRDDAVNEFYGNDSVDFFNRYQYNYSIRSLLNNIREICEDYYDENNTESDDEDYDEDDEKEINEFDPETTDAIDESFDPRYIDDDDIKEIYEFTNRDPRTIRHNEFKDFISKCERCDYPEICDFIQEEVLDPMYDAYVNDESNWREELDSDASYDACYELDMLYLIEHYSSSYENADFVNKIVNEISNMGYDIDEYDEDIKEIWDSWISNTISDEEAINYIVNEYGYDMDFASETLNSWKNQAGENPNYGNNKWQYKVGDKVKFKDAQDIFTITDIRNGFIMISNENNPHLTFTKEDFEKQFEPAKNTIDIDDTEIDEAAENKKESTPMDKLLKLHKEHPEVDIRIIANKVADGNIEEYIKLMKDYYEKFEK